MPQHTESGTNPLAAHASRPPHSPPIAADQYDDPTQGRKIGSDPYDDPTRAR